MSKLFRYRQEQRMKIHFHNCATHHSSKFVDSFRLVQQVKNKSLRKVHQIKCTGCGYSLDVPPRH